MEKTIENIIKIAEEYDWNIDRDGSDITFQKYSNYGQDFYFTLEADSADKLISELDSYIDGYDISYEAYMWLDDSGHGRNGAPYEMIDVYKDMEDCLEMVKELRNHLEYMN